MFTYKQAYDRSKLILTKAGVADAELDSWYLLEYLTGLSRSTYFLRCDEFIEEHMYAEYMKLSEKRAEHIPLQYITGTQEFMGLSFAVTPDVLIPRQDTELLVELAQKRIGEFGKEPSVLDICTGSGCVIVSLAKRCGLSDVTGSDISDAALCVARRNAEQNDVAVKYVKSDLFENIKGRFNIITANPPYIPTECIATLMPEVCKHEPLLALDGKEDGLAFYRRIINAAPEHLCDGGAILLEIGCEQSSLVTRMLELQDFTDIKTTKDYAGLNRVVSAEWHKG